VDEVMFGRYRLFELIGQGGMGAVYRAHDNVIGRDVAIKVLPPDLATEPGYQARFRREAHTAARLAEPHVIPIYDTGEIDGRLYLVMPVVDGVDLENLLENGGPMNPPRAVRVIEQLATALQTAHNAGLIHRDVKPSNALITANEFVYLIDFGIAHDASATKLTRTGSIMGTYAYMAPERFSTGKADVRGDVYALACVFYECLTGQLPYPGDGFEQLIAGHLSGPIPRPSALNPALPAGFDRVIAHGLAKDPQQRYQTAIELATAARQALAEAQPPEPWPTPTPQAPTLMQTPSGQPAPPRRSRRGWIIAGSGAAAAVVATGVVIASLGTKPNPTTAPTPSTGPTTTIAPGRLDSILLTPQEVDTVMGASGMQPLAPVNQSPVVWTSSNPDCAETLHPALDSVYRGSGYTSIRYEQLSEPGSPTHVVEQAAVTFGSADQALGFVKSSAAKMGACAGRNITETENGQVFQLTIGNLVGEVPKITQQYTREAGVTSQRAVRAVSNLVIDVSVSSAQISDQADQIADQMTTKAIQ
jgi:serine/threonine kinase PknH